ncbi:MAG: ABC transporter permease subunit [Cyanobacteriota bacterium]
MVSTKNIYYIAVREFRTIITSPMMYIVLALFFFVSNFFFLLSLEAFNDMCTSFSSDLAAFRISALDINSMVLTQQFINMAFVCIFFLPIFTMRLVADEKKNHTVELLMTSPISSTEIILGKFFAISVIWVIILTITLMYPFSVIQLPYITIDWANFFCALLGLFLYGLFGISIGLFASSLTDNLLISAMIAFFLMAVLYFLINISSVTDSPIGNFAYAVSTFPHFNEFARGLIDTKNIAYFVLGIFFVLFSSERVLESQRWR